LYFSQFQILRTPSIAILASTYMFSGIAAMMFLLTVPGVVYKDAAEQIFMANARLCKLLFPSTDANRSI
jgi:hypothetical protein